MNQEQFYIAGIEFSGDSYQQIDVDRKLKIVFDKLEIINRDALKEVGSSVITLVVLHEYFFTPTSITNFAKKKCLQAISDEIKKYPNMVIIPGSFSNFKNEPDSRLSPEKLEKEIKSVKEAYEIANNDEQHHNIFDNNNLIFALNYFNMILLSKNDAFKTALFLMNCTYAISSVEKVKHYKQHQIYENSILPTFFNNYICSFKYNGLIKNFTVNGIDLSLLMTICRDHLFINQNNLGTKIPDIHVITSNFIYINEEHLLGKINIHMDKKSGLSVFVNKSDYDSGKIKAMLYNIDPNNPAKDVIKSVAIQEYKKYNSNPNSIKCERLIDDAIFIITQKKHTALYHSVRSGYLNISKILLRHGAKADFFISSEGNTALLIACEFGDVEHIKLLLDNNANVNHQNKEGCTPLWSAAQFGHINAVEALFNAGAEINQANNYGNTPSLIAAKNNHLRVVDILLFKGANIDQVNNNNETLASIAIENNDIAMMKVLLDHHLDINQKEKFSALNLLAYAISEMQTEMAALLIENNANVHLMENCSMSPLYLAAFNNDIKIAQLLLLRGAKINQMIPDGETPLTVAVDEGHLDMAKYLINNHADIHQMDNQGLPSLFIAVINGNGKMTELLLLSNPCLTMQFSVTQLNNIVRFKSKNKQETQLKMSEFIDGRTGSIEMTTLNLAKIMDHGEIVDLLEKHMLNIQNQNLAKNSSTLFSKNFINNDCSLPLNAPTKFH